jgi:hypothetical protein
MSSPHGLMKPANNLIGKKNCDNAKTRMLSRRFRPQARTRENPKRDTDARCCEFMRLWLAYGIWAEQGGSKVLFSRDYYPLWSIAPDGTVAADEPWRFVDYSGKTDYVFDDETAPWWNAHKAHEIEHLMEKMGVSGAPKLHDVIAILMRGEAENIRQAVRQMVPPGVQPHALF